MMKNLEYCNEFEWGAMKGATYFRSLSTTKCKYNQRSEEYTSSLRQDGCAMRRRGCLENGTYTGKTLYKTN